VPRFRADQGPVVVGGVGGSGTRVVAEMMGHLGIYTGSDLNKAGDNKWFTFLCKLPRWDLDEVSEDGAFVARSLDLLERAMRGQLAPTWADRRSITEVLERCASHTDLSDDRPVGWLRERAATLRRSRRDVPSGAPSWGWKEPNSHLFLPHLLGHFGDRLRYVHVIRNGVYMAYSRNQSQVCRWGPRFGITVEGATPTPSASLDYWIASNELALARGRAMRPGTFMQVNYDELCAHPDRVVPRFLEFLGLEPRDGLTEELASLPNPPKPPVLTRTQMETEFGEERLARVQRLGFSLEDAA
jgi:hypothetical protein